MPDGLHHPRYANQSFPPYRFLPGRSPHPHSKEGHSHVPLGSLPPKVDHVDAEQWRESGDYLFGCDLYNHGYWWEAHEAWEGLWQTCDKSGPQGRFLQGLIQVAAAHLKLRLGRLDGTHRLLGRGLDHLRFVAGEARGRLFMGLELPVFAERVEEYAAARLARLVESEAGANEHDAATYPYIHLQFDMD